MVNPGLTFFLGGGGRRVREDLPALGGLDRQGEGGLQVRLLEGRVDAAGVRNLELGVDVGLAVGGVDEAVQAFARVHVLAGRVNLEDVVLGKILQCNAVVPVHREGVQGVSVQRDRVDVVGHEVSERGGAFACVELDAGE